MNLSDYKISTKLIASFVLVALFSLLIGLQGLSNTSRINDSTVQLYEKEMMGLSYMKEANIDLLYIGRSARNALLATSDEGRAKALEKLKADVALTKQNMEAARPLFYTERGRDRVRQTR